MKKIIVLATVLFFAGAGTSYAANDISITVNPSNENLKSGTVVGVNENTMLISERETGEIFQFEGGAQVDIKVGDDVVFVAITTPKGRVIVKNVVKRDRNCSFCGAGGGGSW